MKKLYPILRDGLLYTLVILGIIAVYVFAQTNEVTFIYNQF
ncbi:MAG: hypothetical protein AWM53_02058 [Candidatus Dichloromethanomonas elyunquensis]|nr:MAG: hypothetical protein AWM53_02058 [Candidatus Dichloromethanomonas elyunquensis]